MSIEKRTFEDAFSPRERLIMSLSGMALGIGIGAGLVLWSVPDAAIGIRAMEQGQSADELFLLDRAVGAEFIGGVMLAGISATKGGTMVGAAWRDLRGQKQDMTPIEVAEIPEVPEVSPEQPVEQIQNQPPVNEQRAP